MMKLISSLYSVTNPMVSFTIFLLNYTQIKDIKTSLEDGDADTYKTQQV